MIYMYIQHKPRCNVKYIKYIQVFRVLIITQTPVSEPDMSREEDRDIRLYNDLSQ